MSSFVATASQKTIAELEQEWTKNGIVPVVSVFNGRDNPEKMPGISTYSMFFGILVDFEKPKTWEFFEVNIPSINYEDAMELRKFAVEFFIQAKNKKKAESVCERIKVASNNGEKLSNNSIQRLLTDNKSISPNFIRSIEKKIVKEFGQNTLNAIQEYINTDIVPGTKNIEIDYLGRVPKTKHSYHRAYAQKCNFTSKPLTTK